MAQEDKNEEAFYLFLTALQALTNAVYAEKIMTIFKIKMLVISGFKPHLDSCVSCGQRITGQSKFSLSLGGLLCMKCVGKDENARIIFKGTIATILHIEKNDFKNNLNLGMNPHVRKELNLVLNAFFNFHLEKELKSEKMLNKLRYHNRQTQPVPTENVVG